MSSAITGCIKMNTVKLALQGTDVILKRPRRPQDRRPRTVLRKLSEDAWLLRLWRNPVLGPLMALPKTLRATLPMRLLSCMPRPRMGWSLVWAWRPSRVRRWSSRQRRLYQGAKLKLRVIDDARQSGLNEAYQRTCAATLMDLDSLTCVIASLAKAIVEGTFQGTEVHELVRLEQWLGRTLDLSRAYKQLAIDPASRRVCILGFQKGTSWVYYRCNVLPFGARASVFSFLRVSRSLHFIMAKYLSALNTVFFDDYPMVTTGTGSLILLKSASSVLNLLGWAHAEEGEKAPGFQQEFVALGVQISLHNLGQGKFTIRNKPGRVEKLITMIQEAATNPEVAKSLPELHGHLNFASGLFYNKGLKFISKALNKASSDPASDVFPVFGLA